MNLNKYTKDLSKLEYFLKIKNFYQNNKKMSIVSLSSFLLVIVVMMFSAWWNGNEVEKLDFFVETKTLQDFTNEIEINKPGKIVWAQEIVITAQAMWNVKNIFYKEWDTIWENTKLIEINDSIANYNLMVQRAKNALNATRLQYWQSKTQIEQSIQNTQIALESSKNNLNTTQILWEQNIKSAKNTLQTADSQRNSIILQMDSEKTKLESLLENVLHQNDTILWVTNKYKTANDSFEIYLSAKNSSFKIQWETQLLWLYRQKTLLKELSISQNIKNIEIKDNIKKIDTIYKDIKDFLVTMQNILTNSVSSTSLPQSQIDGLIASNNWLQASMQWNLSLFTNLKQTVDSSLIEQGWEIKVIWSEATQIWYNSTIASTEQQISNATLWFKTAEINYQSILNNKNSALWLASTNIKSAEIAYQDALNQLEKLNIKAPITGTIWKILVDKGQEIWMWTPIITIINKQEPMAEVWITSNEYNQINSWSRVLVEYMWEIISGSILSVSSQAGWNGLYNATIKLNKKVENIWDVAKIKI